MLYSTWGHVGKPWGPSGDKAQARALTVLSRGRKGQGRVGKFRMGLIE